MKRWQKIAGMVFIILLVTAHIAVFSDYASLVEATGIWDAHLDEEWFFYYFGKYRHHFYAYHLLSLIDCCVIVSLFVCLWRKGGKR